LLCAVAVVMVVMVFGLNNFVARFPSLLPAVYVLAFSVLAWILAMLVYAKPIAPTLKRQAFFQSLLALPLGDMHVPKETK
jgi:threonine/homoserine/homoserine lactone efflux protein